VAEARIRSRARVVRAPAVLAMALVAAALAVAALAGCGSPALSGDDPLAGYWIGGGKTGMRLVHIVKEGDSYRVFANPDYEPPRPTMKDGALVVDTHSVVMSLIPAGTDKLDLEYSGEMFKTPETIAMKRVDQATYADAATGFGINALRDGLAMWKAGGGKEYPPVEEMSATGMLGKMIAWPNNLFTGQPMQLGDGKGNFTYKLLAGGKKYSLVGHLSDGKTIGE
jgi:hypothetical protein